jgi:hypothetical protein
MLRIHFLQRWVCVERSIRPWKMRFTRSKIDAPIYPGVELNEDAIPDED